jgi:type I restriction enzyme R subunit
VGSASNFAFLGVYDKRLVTLGGLAERYFRDDPSTAIVKLRQFAEFIAKMIAARHGAYEGERETFEETFSRLPRLFGSGSLRCTARRTQR